MIRIQVCLYLKTGRHKTFSEMADIRQFIRSELSIIKKEVIESTRSMIRNEIRSISFDSNLWILFLVLIYGPSPSPRYNLLVTIYQWFTFCTMSNCSLSSTYFIPYLHSEPPGIPMYSYECRYDSISLVLICSFFRPPTCLFWWAFFILTIRILKIKFAIGQKFRSRQLFSSFCFLTIIYTISV